MIRLADDVLGKWAAFSAERTRASLELQQNLAVEAAAPGPCRVSA
jgi:hypothetical protein